MTHHVPHDVGYAPVVCELNIGLQEAHHHNDERNAKLVMCVLRLDEMKKENTEYKSSTTNCWGGEAFSSFIHEHESVVEDGRAGAYEVTVRIF